MSETVEDLGGSSGGSFPVLSPKKIKLNEGQHGQLATFDTAFGRNVAGNPLGNGHIEYYSGNVNCRDNTGSIRWAITTITTYKSNIISPVYFKHISGG